jgi:hypothetical protein
MPSPNLNHLTASIHSPTVPPLNTLSSTQEALRGPGAVAVKGRATLQGAAGVDLSESLLKGAHPRPHAVSLAPEAATEVAGEPPALLGPRISSPHLEGLVLAARISVL